MKRIMESEMGRKLDAVRMEIRFIEAQIERKRVTASKLNDPIARKTVARDRFKLEQELESLRAQERKLEQGIF
jgi:TATA-binding protein-associated factor Taf7